MVSGKFKELYDLVVVGGGPAGASAAFHAARSRASVLVLERDEFPRARGGVGWIGPAGVALCREMKLSAKQAGAGKFSGLRLHSWNLRQSADVRDPELVGWAINRAAFDDALLKLAVAKGAQAVHGASVNAVSLGERQVSLTLTDGREVAGKIVLVADGVSSHTSSLVGVAPAARDPHVSRCAFVEYETDKSATSLDVILGSGRAGLLAIVVRLGKAVRIVVSARADQETLDQHFHALRLVALESGLASSGAPESPSHGLSPAGVALDLDTHVGKRCLLTGDAGGFVAAFSQEGIYPAMRSGRIAAETALRALEAPLMQDELATFGHAWRGELADYLRMPNTDLSLLTPLVFNNEQMSLRVARAFLLGRPF